MTKRQLGYFETLLYFAHQRGMSQMTFHLTMRGKTCNESIKNACRAAYDSHSLLRTKVVDREGILYFEPLESFESIPIAFVDETDKSNLQLAINRIRTQQMPLNEHNWKVSAFRPHEKKKEIVDLVIHFSHVVADGISMVSVLQQIVQSIDNQTLERIHTADVLNNFDSIETLLAKKITLEDFFASQQHNIEPVQVQPTPQDSPEIPLKPYIECTIRRSDLNTLRGHAKKEGVTLNQVLNSALILAYFKTIGFTKDVHFGSALNLRNKCHPKVPKNICGNYFAPVNVSICSNDCSKGIWHLAKAYKAGLGRVILNEKFLPTVYDPKKMNETVRSFMSEKKGLASENIGSSFLGEIEFSTESVNVLDFSFHPKHAGQINLMSYIVAGNLKMMICFDRNYRTKTWVKMLANNFLAELRSCL